jgi:hypothetical protein
VSDDGGILVAMPERYGLPAVPSERRRCARCLGAVWVSVRGTSWSGVIVCLTCAMALLHPSDTIQPAPWILEDLAELGGDG